ncbi:MAG: arginine--tRNA ligase [Defluviitaleaceae bacterium]|nr:arginine--tRNA ligase [Defluviitaleaceae bacterium]
MNIKELLAKKISEILNEDKENVYKTIEQPKDKGDFAFPCFRFAKAAGKNPAELATFLAERLKIDVVRKIEVVNAYVNFFIKTESLANIVFERSLEHKPSNNKTVVIDFSSPNIAKHFHIGHLRSTVIGGSLRNIYNHLGYNTIGVNHLGDWGTQFGKLIVAFKKYSSIEEVREHGIDVLMRIYARFTQEAKEDESLNDEARAYTVKLEQGDSEAVELWQYFKEISLAEFDKVYKRLGIEFEYTLGESFYIDKIPGAIKELEDKGILLESEGARIVDLEEYKLPPCLMFRKDGGSLYHTRDLAAILYRKSEYKFDKIIYVTAVDQITHFKQLFAVVKKLGFDFDMQHAAFGLVTLPEGKLSTREGRVVLMSDLINQTVAKVRNIIEEKNPTLANKDEVAEQVGVGALIFNDLFNGRIKDIVFSFEHILNFEGETGPLVQYTHARACSILRKNCEKNYEETDEINHNLFECEYSHHLLYTLYMFDHKLEDVIAKDEPYLLSRYLIDLAGAFNRFYHNVPILSSETETKNARLALVRQTKNTIKKGLELLGIKAPEEM